jgi:hypothetical protein
MGNHVAFSPARKTHSISVPCSHFPKREMNHARSSSDTDFSIIFPELLFLDYGNGDVVRTIEMLEISAKIDK